MNTGLKWQADCPCFSDYSVLADTLLRKLYDGRCSGGVARNQDAEKIRKGCGDESDMKSRTMREYWIDENPSIWHACPFDSGDVLLLWRIYDRCDRLMLGIRRDDLP